VVHETSGIERADLPRIADIFSVISDVRNVPAADIHLSEVR
jgi:hypothetical protein